MNRLSDSHRFNVVVFRGESPQQIQLGVVDQGNVYHLFHRDVERGEDLIQDTW